MSLPYPHSCQSRARGFSLIELMIVLAIIGIILAIAMPAYQEYARKGLQAGAKSFMLFVATRQKQYLVDTRGYAAALTDLGITAPSEITDNFSPLTINTTAPSGVIGPFFTLTLTPIPGGKADGGGELVVRSDGIRTIGGVAW